MNILDSLNGLLVTNPTNIRYLTGFVAVEKRDAYVLVTKNKTYFFTSSLYLEQAKKLSPIQITRDNPIAKELEKLCKKLRIKKLGFEESDLTVSEFNRLKALPLVPTINRIEGLRMIKRADEITNIRLAANITDKCFKFIRNRIRPGITEARLAMEIEGYFKYKRAENAFSPIVAFNEHSSQPHYLLRGNSPLRRGSLVLLDFGAKINGYCADMTRVVFLGAPRPKWKRAYDAVLQAQQKALDLLAGGTRNGATLDKTAKESIAKAGFLPYSHSLGHNIGLDIHEGPRLSVKHDETLAPGMICTIEPGLYVEGAFGIRIEDAVHIKDRGIEILTKSPKTLTSL